jgi:hypothetical protein
VGLDNWLRVENGRSSLLGPIDEITYACRDFWISALKPKEGEVIIQENMGLLINIENGVWSVPIEQPVDYTELENLRVVCTNTSQLSAKFRSMSDKNMAIFQKIFINVPWLNRSDTVAVEYRFLIPKENATKVSVDDWLESYTYAICMSRPYENAPDVTATYIGPAIKCEFTIALYKNLNGSWEKVAYYHKTWDSWHSGSGVVTNF